MRLNPEQLHAIEGLVHYLNDKFDGHGLEVRVTLSETVDSGFEGDKGEITVVERLTDKNDAPLLTYSWATGD